MTLQKPELLALAGALALAHASFQLAAAYDGSINVWAAFTEFSARRRPRVSSSAT